MNRAAVADAANDVGRLSRHGGAPRLTVESSRETLTHWLQWCDPNGSHTDARAIADDCDAHDVDGAWEAIAAMVRDS